MTVKLKKEALIDFPEMLPHLFLCRYLQQQVIKILVKSRSESVQDLNFRLGIQTKVSFTIYSVR